jgi:hypothetical protein
MDAGFFISGEYVDDHLYNQLSLVQRVRKKKMENNKKPNALYYASLRYGTYTGLSFLTALGCIIPITRTASALIILGYTSYTAFSIFRAYTHAESQGKYGKKALRFALSIDGIELIFIVLALLVGLTVGVVS